MDERLLPLAPTAQTTALPRAGLQGSGGREGAEQSRAWAVGASWGANFALLVGKGAVVWLSSSKVMTAAMVDSAVDLLSQVVLLLAERRMSRQSAKYPVGRSRLEALSVIACAFIMTMASVEVIQFSATDLSAGLQGRPPDLEVGVVLYAITGAGVVVKFLLWGWCSALGRTTHSDILATLAEDHLNDVLSNSAAMLTVTLAFHTAAWWIDSVGAIGISFVVIYRWWLVITEQVKKIEGHTAPVEFICQIQQLAVAHDTQLVVDSTRIYHFGARYNVEMEIVLPAAMSVRESHDLAVALQNKIEDLPVVERAFVHVDHERRDGLEHKMERQLARTRQHARHDPAVNLPIYDA